MKVYGYKTNEKGIMEIENEHEAFQEFVKGDIEIMSLTEDLKLVCKKDEQSDNESMEINAVWIDNDEVVDIICGNCFVCRYAENGFSNIKDSDILVI
ncbi:MAG: DUF3846 domain-containing protein, partial [Lachnospiraceae bacterium]|nr:DUF3846 domain-containing protein [Lachnospiraceae bacterium]